MIITWTMVPAMSLQPFPTNTVALWHAYGKASDVRAP